MTFTIECEVILVGALAFMPPSRKRANASENSRSGPTWPWVLLILSIVTLVLQLLPTSVTAVVDPLRWGWREFACLWVFAIVVLVIVRSGQQNGD
jgi:hypothetical protein